MAANEIADQLAKQASGLDFIKPEPAIGLTTTAVRSEVRLWTCRESEKVLAKKSIRGFCQAKII